MSLTLLSIFQIALQWQQWNFITYTGGVIWKFRSLHWYYHEKVLKLSAKNDMNIKGSNSSGRIRSTDWLVTAMNLSTMEERSMNKVSSSCG